MNLIENENDQKEGVHGEPNDQMPHLLSDNKENLAASPIPSEFLLDQGNAETNPWTPSKHYVFALN